MLCMLRGPVRWPSVPHVPHRVVARRWQKLCGRLIGKNGTFVNMLKARTGAHVIIRLHPVKSSVKICSVDGE